MSNPTKHSGVCVFGVGVFLLVGVGNARASVSTFFDDLESSKSQWGFYASNPSVSFSEVECCGFAKSGTHDGVMTIDGPAGPWAQLGRNVTMSVITAPRTCAAYLSMQGWNAHGQLEIIDIVSWTHLAIKPFNIKSGSQYVAVITDVKSRKRQGDLGWSIR